MYSVGEKVGRMRTTFRRSRQLYPVESISTETATFSVRLPSRKSLAMLEASGIREVIVTARLGCISFRSLVKFVACVWLTAKMMDLPSSPEGSRWAFFRNDSHMTRLRPVGTIFLSSPLTLY